MGRAITKIIPDDPPGYKLIVVDELGRRKEISHYGERFLDQEEVAAVARMVRIGKGEQVEILGGVRVAKEHEKRLRERA